MLGPQPTGLKRRATVRMLPRPHHPHPPAQRVRSSATFAHSGWVRSPASGPSIGLRRVGSGSSTQSLNPGQPDGLPSRHPTGQNLCAEVLALPNLHRAIPLDPCGDLVNFLGL